MIAIALRPMATRPPAILALKSPGAYNSLDGVLSLITREWDRAGIRIIWVDLSFPDWEKRLLAEIEANQIRLCIATGFGGRFRFEDEYLWEHFRIPFVTILHDHPGYFGMQHRDLPRGVVLAYVYRDHALYQRDHVKSANLVITIDLGVPVTPAQLSPDAGRGSTAQVIFAKTGNDPLELEAKWAARPAIAGIIHDILDEVGLQNCSVFPAAIGKVASAHRLELQPFDKISRFLIVQVDDYIRRRKSTLIVEAIKKFPVDIYGGHWDHISRHGAQARFRGAVQYSVLEYEIARSIASITMNPNVDLAVHDRFYTALGAGVMPITDSNTFTKTNFPTLAPYTFNFFGRSVEAALERVFTRPREATEIARAARNAAVGSLSTQHAANDILRCAELIDFFEFSFEPPQNYFIS